MGLNIGIFMGVSRPVRIFLETASINDVREICEWGIIDGVTTNQKIFQKEGNVDFKQRVLEICEAANGPVSVETTTHGVSNLLKEAREYSKWHKNVVVKVAMAGNGEGLKVVSQLNKEGIKTNMTVMMNFNQLVLASKAGATYVSLFYNRAKDAGEDPIKAIKDYVSFAKNNNAASLIVGSIRKPEDVTEAVRVGAHIVTVTPEIIRKLPFHPKSEETIEEFDKAWKDFTALKEKN